MQMIPLYLMLCFSPAISDAARTGGRDPLPPATQEDLSGVYWCEGKQGKKAYRGTVIVTRLGALYLFQWQLVAGLSYEGVGIRRGDTVSVGWTMDKSRGATAYHVLPGGRLDGRWVSIVGTGTDGESHTETLTLLRRVPPAGD